MDPPPQPIANPISPASSTSSVYPPAGHQAHYGGRDNIAVTAAAALQQDASASFSPTAHGRKRRAGGAPSSRGVANLTPEQLAKKRANDREAQRAIRERTRNTIESLERRIHELESQQPYQELQRVAQERDRALAECEELKRRLAQVAGIAGGSGSNPSSQGQPNLHELATVTAQQSPLPPRNQQVSPQQYTQPPTAQGIEQSHLHPDLRSPHSMALSSPASQSTVSGHSSTAFTTDTTRLRRWSPSLDRLAGAQSSTANDIIHDHLRSASAYPQTTSNGERLGVNFLLDQANSMPAQGHALRSASGDHQQSSPPWVQTPKNIAPTCPLDSILGDFISDRRSQLRAGVNAVDVLGPEYPSFSGVPASPNPLKEKPHPLSQLLLDMAHKFPSISQLPEQVAVLYVVYVIVRYMICPCETCYHRLPPWIRLIEEQITLPHAVWNDYIPWPSIRARLCTAATPGTTVSFDEFFVPYTTTLSLNWPYPQEQILLPSSSDNSTTTEPLVINPVFEAHLLDLKNWSVGSDFKQKFPELVDHTVRITDH